MKKMYVGSTIFVLLLGLSFNLHTLSTDFVTPDGGINQLLTNVQRFALNDAISSGEEWYGYTETPEHPPLEVVTSDVQEFDYMAVSPYYKVFFKGTTVKMVMGGAWISFELPEQDLGEMISDVPTTDENSLSISEVFTSLDMSYRVDTSLLTEVLILQELKSFDRLIEKISWAGMTPEFQEDGSILFSCGEKEILKILPPFMKDAEGVVCEDIYYDLIETETGYELHKVFNENGLRWLEEAVYPVIIDPSMQTMEDAWGSSGLTPYGFINPATGRLTVTQTDLVIPGRGLDLVISRIYETPAVFYGSSPYDYEAPPVDVGKGWQLDFPYVGSKYLHLFGGGIYKIEWSGSTFENHKGTHFKLVKNGDSTYTLTTANGMVYEFDTSGKLTQIKDVDQNTISFTYSSGILTTITDTIGRTVSLTYSSNRLWKITYNSEDIEYSYDANGCLMSMEDFLNRETNYYYNSGYNNWLLSKIIYKMGGYTEYTYCRFSDNDYYKYHVTHQRVYETNQVQHIECSYTGSFEAITSSSMTMQNESNVTQGSDNFTMNSNGLITEIVIKNASSSPIRKYTYTYNSKNEVTQKNVYYNGTNLSYTNYCSYDNWGNAIYIKNGEGHERFLSYANTSTSGFFIDNTGTIIKTFTNAFSNSTVPSAVHNALLGTVEKQDNTYVKEVYVTYDSEAHPTQMKTSFGNTTTWVTYSGTFNEKTGDTSFAVDLTGYTVAGNGALQITGLGSDDIYTESHSGFCPGQCDRDCKSVSGSWQGGSYKLNYQCCIHDLNNPPTYETCLGSYDQYIGPFTHYPGTLGYQNYYTTPSIGSKFSTFAVTTRWKAYPTQVKYNLDNSDWTTISSNLNNGTAQITVPITGGSHTLYFSESSSYNTKFSWYLYVPVDNTPDTYITTAQYDAYGNTASVTDPESNSVTLTYSSTYSYAYLTEISRTVGQDTVSIKANYDYYRGWITSIQQPRGVEAGTGFDILYTYDVVGRVIKTEYPLLQGQSERSYMEIVYDCENRTITLIDQLRHYVVQQYDKLGRLTDIKLYTGTYGSGTLYATTSCTYQYDNSVSTVTDPGNHTITYTYDFFGRNTQIQFPDSSTVSYTYDDTNNKVTLTSGRGYDRIYWLNWVGRLIKVEEEYATDLFAVTTYQYDEIGHVTSITDAENHTTTYTYASFYGLTKTTYPDSEYEEYEYDDIGNITSFTDANGNETVYTYDSLQRLTEIEHEDQSTVSFTYDLNSNRTRMDDDAPNTGDYIEYTYDKWNRLITETRHINQDTYAVSYQYDVENRLTELTYPDDMQILYSYDDLNRLTEIKRYVDGSNDEILMDNIQYNTENLLTQFDYGNDLRATFTYDSNHRVLTHDIKDGGTSYLDLDYTWDSNNNITQLVNGWRDTNFDWNSDTESYSYDGVDRLTSASCTSWSHTYTYDKVGNRTAKDGITYTVNAVNQVTGLSDGTSFTYDSNGNMTGKTKGSDTWDYMYNNVNGLTEVEKNDTTIGEYVYDGDGQRMQVTEDDLTTLCIYYGLNVLYEKTATGTANYIYGSTGRLAKRTTIQGETHTFYYHTDHLESTRLVTDESADVIVNGSYEPFGESTVAGEESYLFTGKEMDETSLYYFNARYYDSDLGRFITRDPIAGEETNPQSLNLYTYCGNNPLKFVDPTGLFFRMCLENGNCLWIFENGPKRGQWIAKDAEGNTITDSEEIDSLLDAGKFLEALVLILQFFGYDVSVDDIHYDDKWKDKNGNVDYEKILMYDRGSKSYLGYIEFEQDGITTRIDVNIFCGFYGSCGHTDPPENNKITMTLNLATRINANEFLHIVGHELIHMHQYLSGQYTDWVNIYGPAGAEAMAETVAYHWNLRLDLFGVTFDHELGVPVLGHHQSEYKKWLIRFFKRIK